MTRLLLLHLFLIPFAICAQKTVCGTQMVEQNSELNEDSSEKSHNTYYNSVGEMKSDSTLLVIPVVFHILHEYGDENISDNQVYDAIRVLNEEFGGYDDDSVNIIPLYKNKNANTFIEFRLASIDPDGNCTNGIEHIYSHECRNGDDYSKLNRWDRSKYLNIWTNLHNNNSLIGYTYFPEQTNGKNFWKDGIMMNYDHVGSIETSWEGWEYDLTHQIGHYLHLYHTFGAAVGVCGDDGITDTPPTKSQWTWCETDTTVLKDCGTEVEDINNYMDSPLLFCKLHFTAGQADAMRYALLSIDGERYNLSLNSNLIETGVDNAMVPQTPLTVPICKPVADFNATPTRACINHPIEFKDASWNAVIDSWEWEFEDGSPATSTIQNPTVTFGTHGWKDIRLIVTNSAGTDTLTLDDYIYIAPDWADFNGPTLLDIEATQHWLFIVENPENNEPRFHPVDSVGYDLSTAFKLNNYKDVSNAIAFTDDFFYDNRLGKSLDYLMSPSFDFTYVTDVTVGFWYSYATKASTPQGDQAVLKVYSTKKCGIESITRKTLPSQLMGTIYDYQNDYIPNSNSQWNYAQFTYSPDEFDTKTRFIFEFEASDSSNNFYIDEITVDGILSTENISDNGLKLKVSPNPVSNELNISGVPENGNLDIRITNVMGQIIRVLKLTNNPIDVSDLSSGVYLLEVDGSVVRFVKK